MKKLFTGLLAIGLFVAPSSLAFAQTVIAVPSQMPTSCLTMTLNMRLGATDVATGGYVSALQNFLINQGYFSAAYLGSGRFGPITTQSVMRFQAAYGLPATGYVGPLTRALIQKISCGGDVFVPPTQALSISSLSPSIGQIGTRVTIWGYGFSNSNTVLMDGSVVATNVSQNPVPAIACFAYDPNCIARPSITFTIPDYIQPYCPSGNFCAMMVRQVTPGNYNVSVSNSNGTSNALLFTVTGNSNNQPLSISGIDAPTSLTIGQTGTWTVRATTGSNSGNLHYSVVWGDENYATNMGIMMPQPSTTQSSATFTHTYRISGTYTPVFTVTNDSGASATVSASTVVNPIY